jgi:hypothetical protein
MEKKTKEEYHGMDHAVPPVQSVIPLPKKSPWMEFQGAITIAFGSACSTAGGTGKVVLKRGRETAER